MTATTQAALTFRKPTGRDGAAVHALVDACKPLDLNSCYAYLLLCEHFADTCVVAELDGALVGFVSAYHPPSRPEVIFVWQVAVGEAARGRGVAGQMLDTLLARETCQSVTHLETTISPSNEPSQRLFRGLAKRRKTDCEETAFFTEEFFGAEAHEEEVLFRIGPL